MFFRDSAEDFSAWLGPFGKRGRFFESGEARLAVLSLLGETPRHGYELIKEIETRSGGLARVSAGTIYPTLQLLEDEGLVISHQQDNKRVYQITEAGRAELDNSKEAVERIWERAKSLGDWAPWLGSPGVLVMSQMRGLIKAALQASAKAAGDHQRNDRIREILDRARHDLEGLGKANPESSGASPH